jgi:hypothetical protein
MPWRKKDKLAELVDDSPVTQASHLRADVAAMQQAAQRPKIESIISFIAERREENGFGRDYQISQTRRI